MEFAAFGAGLSEAGAGGHGYWCATVVAVSVGPGRAGGYGRERLAALKTGLFGNWSGGVLGWGSSGGKG